MRDDTFPRDFFDAITAFQVFEHVSHPAREAARLHHMLKPGGVILVEVPNFDTWSMRLMGPRHRHFVQKHITFFSASTLTLLLEKHGFELLSTYHPSRRMTVRHLVTDWSGRYLPQRLVSAAERLIKRLGLWTRVVSLNLGDIVTVIARKQAHSSMPVLASLVSPLTAIGDTRARDARR